MSDLGNANWSETDASNNAVAPNGWPEGMNPSDVNNSARANMGAIKRFWDRINAIKTTAGTSTAYTLTYDVAAASYYDGELFAFVFDQACGATPTLNINALGARNLRKYTGGAWANLAASDVTANQGVIARYNLSATTFDIIAMALNAADFVTLAGNNSFTGTQSFAGTVTMTDKAINEAQGANIASAATTDIGAATGNYVKVTGTTAITALGTVQAGTRRVVEFTGALTLTHNATSLILPTGANITTAAGDVAMFVSEGSGNWRCAFYQLASGKALVYGTQSLGANGYLQLGSFILQWGQTGSVAAGGAAAVTFPVAFASAGYSVSCQPITAASGAQAANTVTAITTTGMTITNNSPSSAIVFSWMAIGQ